MSDTLANLFASKFIARTDVKALAHPGGWYSPVEEPWTRADLNAHLAGEKVYGHYLLNASDQCKFFAFDIDLEKNKPNEFQGYYPDDDLNIREFNPRYDWRDRSHPSQKWQTYQLKMMASMLMKAIWEECEIPCATAYSGAKGVHVYGFTGLMPAEDVRYAAQEIVIPAIGHLKPSRGDNFYKWDDSDPITGYPNLSIELFPKQDSLEGKKLGNLLRLPLGRNIKSQDKTFFIDLRSPMSVMKPADPVWALTTTNPWGDN